MNIIVCIKQVPGSNIVEIDEATGVMKRDSAEAKMNPYDLYTIETAMYIKEKTGAKVTAVTMGPDQTTEIIKEAYMMGVDDGYVLTDRKFAGADVLATSYTLSQGISAIGLYDLIICGKQTTDGDTAQVGPALAEYLDIPHVAWVKSIIDVSKERITVEQDLGHITQITQICTPCLITVEKGIFEPRLPSYSLKLSTAGRKVNKLTFRDYADQDEGKYGLRGSATSVERTWVPEACSDQVYMEGDCDSIAAGLFEVLKSRKFIQEV
ncbi:MAG: electron transfer flavoprotein subunit beta/FixA family protein [Deltaproteobacteria bacterium]|nr:electron transfer flavoprotein subunit beta/FixA family protein [Deltaproteobacteria bacterium]